MATTTSTALTEPPRARAAGGLARRAARVWSRPDGEATTRLVGLDVARCIALLGMMVAHILPKTVAGRIPWQQVVAGGRASGLFAVLAGTSLALMGGGLRPVSGPSWWPVARGLAVRAVLITLLGLALDKLHDKGVGVILPYYGVLFLLGIPWLAFGARRLFVLAAVSAVALPVLSQVARPHLPITEGMGLSHLNPWQLVTNLTLTGDYPALPWLAFLFTGMALGRLDLRAPEVARRIVIVGAGIAVSASLLSDAVTRSPVVRAALLSTWRDGGSAPTWHQLELAMGAGLSGTTPTGSWWWLTVQAAHSATPFDLAQTTGCALVVIGACLLAARRAPRAWQVVFGAGAMSLTSYSLHLVMLDPKIWPDVGRPRFWPEALVVLAVGAAFALLRWRGPLEGLVTVAARAASRGWGSRLAPTRRAGDGARSSTI